MTYPDYYYRGGCWLSSPEWARVADLNQDFLIVRSERVGFRLVRRYS